MPSVSRKISVRVRFIPGAALRDQCFRVEYSTSPIREERRCLSTPSFQDYIDDKEFS